MAEFPSHATFNKPLGINMHSTIYKPPYHRSFHHAGSAYGHEARWSMQPRMNQQVTVYDNYYYAANGAFPNLDTIRYSHMHPFGAFEGSSLTNLSATANKFGRHVDLSRGDISSN